MNEPETVRHGMVKPESEDDRSIREPVHAP